MDATIVIAGYAAVVATAALVWNIVQALWYRRRRLRVTASTGWASTGGFGKAKQRVVVLEARNTGHIPIYLKECGLSRDRQPIGNRIALHLKPLPDTLTLPVTLQPGDSFRLTSSASDVTGYKPQTNATLADFDRVYFADGLDGYWFAKVPDGFIESLESASP